MYRIVTEQRGATFRGVPRMPGESGFRLDVPALVEAARGADLVWLCEPNNPTGSAEPPDRLEALLVHLATDSASAGKQAPAVVIDEAYVEFTGASTVGLRNRYPRLAIIRTLSKAHALAGARVGFAVANRTNLAPIKSFRAPASVSTVSAALATVALRRPDLAAANVARIAEQRARMISELSAVGWRPYQSAVNFILFRFSSPAAAGAAAETLLNAGLVPRTFGREHPLADCLRLTVRSAAENDRLFAAARGIPA
jgi:histidinol-phosphate aminotransferase